MHDVATAFAVVAFFAVFGNIQSGEFDFFSWTKSHDHLNRISDHQCADDCQHEGDGDGFDLFDPKSAIGDEFGEAIGFGGCASIGDVRVAAVGGGKHASEECADGSANSVDAEGVERVVITEPALDLPAGEVGDETGGNANDNRTVGIDETASRSDHNQSGNCARAEAEDARFAAGDVFGHSPDK